MRVKKIRGLKRRHRELESWVKFHEELDMARLKENGFVYAKAKIAPWANLFNKSPYPSNYRRVLFSCLLDFYLSWKETLDKEFDSYYLKIWLSFPKFIDSQIVCAIGERIPYYNDIFESCDPQPDFPISAFRNEELRIKRFNWTTYYDYDYYPESDYLNLNPDRFLSPEDFYAEKRFYKKLLKDNVPYKMIPDTEERLFYKQRGYIWVGELIK